MLTGMEAGMSVRRYRCHHTTKAGMPAPAPRMLSTPAATFVRRKRICMHMYTCKMKPPHASLLLPGVCCWNANRSGHCSAVLNGQASDIC
jgi:hypothetical protein